jgi:hypothetical protein
MIFSLKENKLAYRTYLFLSHQSVFYLKKENHVEEEHADCETIPSVEPSNSRSITDVLKEEEQSFREVPFENVSCSKEAFHSLDSSTYYFLYPNLFNGLILYEVTYYPIQINSTGSTLLKYLMAVTCIWKIEQIRSLPMNLVQECLVSLFLGVMEML